MRIFIDNYTSDVYFKGRGAVSQKWSYGFTYCIAGFIILLLSASSLSEITPSAFVLFLLSGMLSSTAGIPYYKALEIEDSTNLGIFMQLAPILYLIFGWFMLGETFSSIQLVAFIIILSAPVLIIFTTRKRSRKIKIRAAFYAFLYVLIAVIGNLIFVKANDTNFNFISEIAIVFLGKGLGNLIIILLNPKWKKRFYQVFKSSRKKILRPILANSIINISKDVVYRSALIAAPAAIVSAVSDSTEPIVIFFMGVIFTIIWPKFGREKLNKKTVLVHLTATLLIVIGIVILRFQNS